MNPPSIPTPWMSIAETAEYMRLGKRTVEALVAAERLASSVIETIPGSTEPCRLIHRDDADGQPQVVPARDERPADLTGGACSPRLTR